MPTSSLIDGSRIVTADVLALTTSVDTQAAILKVYCSDKLPEFQDNVGDLDFDDTIKD